MDFEFTQEEEALRSQVQAFIKDNLTPEVLADLAGGKRGRGFGPRAKGIFEKIADRGWNAIAWPKAYGGQGGSRITQFLVEEEFYRAAQVVIGGGGTGTPAVLASGTEEQKQYYVPRAIRREIIFCQGYSEPQCGTDLAGVRCRATRVGTGADAHYVVNGQKVFTTNAQVATHVFLLVRTDPESRRHAGLSILLVPMDTPGITIRPMYTIQNNPGGPPGTTYGEERTNEVFFDDVKVPVSCLLGQEGDGWAVSQRGLNLDRVGAWRYLISIKRDEDFANWLKSDDPRAADLRDDEAVRDKVAELWIEAQLCRLMTMRSMSIEQRGEGFTYEGAAEKVFAPEHGVRTTEAIAQLLGPHAQLLNGSPGNVQDGLYAHNLLSAFQSTVNHGSVQVMRDQIARKGLDLPKPRK
ncbi:MAG: acyl-CoA dehydrogenase family protein [Rhodoferax sp.]|nr:acyl-CoA dehydrogenase family protein [Rhodoferax sp.]MCP5264354.1 acyl-CoA dehydrogenase family protein [Rhodoferax sp.]